MKHKSLIRMTCVGLTVLIFLAACGPAQTAEVVVTEVNVTREVEVTREVVVTAHPGLSEKEYYAVLGSLVHPYIAAVQAAGEEAALELGVQYTALSPIQWDPVRELEMYEDLVTLGVWGISADAGNPSAFQGPIQEAKKRGVVTILWGGCSEDTAADMCLISVPEQGGAMAIERVAELLGGKGKIAIVEAAVTNETVHRRVAGAVEAIKRYPDMEIVQIVTDADTPDGSLKAGENVLAANPDVDAILGLCQLCAVGAAAAVESAGKAGEIIVTAYDDSPEIIQGIKDGLIDSTLVQQPWTQGYASIFIMREIHNGRVPKQKVLDLGHILVTIDNVDTYQKDVEANARAILKNLDGLFK